MAAVAAVAVAAADAAVAAAGVGPGWWLADCPLTDDDFARQEEVFAIEQEARAAGRLPEITPGQDEDGPGFDPGCAPAGIEQWATGQPGTPDPPPVPGIFPMDLLARGLSPGSADGPPFAHGTALDAAPPGPVLAGALERTCGLGFGDITDDQLAGIMLAAQRQQSRASAELLAAVSELAHRRGADPDPRVGEATDTEIAITLARTRRSAGRLVRFATDLAVLPATRAALWAGRIDAVKAELIGYETGLLSPGLAAAIELLVIEDAPRLTTTALRGRLRRAIIAADPAAARRRATQARRDARVELYDERSGGTAALSGRDLPVAGALAADQRIDATARALKASGVQATLAQLRAAVFLALLTGADPHTFLPPSQDDDGSQNTSPTTGADAQPGTGPPGTGQAGGQPGTSGGSSGDPASPSGQPATSPDPPGRSGPTAPGTTGPGAGDGGRPHDGTTPARGSDPAAPGGSGPAPTQPDTASTPPTPDATGLPHPASLTDGTPGAERADEGAGGWPGKLTLRGSVHLTLPLATWLGASLSPGEITGLGPATAHTCQQVADWITESPGTRWCLTLTGKSGHAVAHGCATRPPPPAANTQRLAGWLARLKISPIQAGDCTHAREVPGYRPPRSLHHAVQVRQKTCFNPVCARPAHNCDDDHTIPYDQGGRTCECDLGPGCRKCHQVKQTPGWTLEQPSPGVFVWRLPNGRRYTIHPGIYPT